MDSPIANRLRSKTKQNQATSSSSSSSTGTSSSTSSSSLEIKEENCIRRMKEKAAKLAVIKNK